MVHLYLTRRNLLTLLSKLDRKAAGEDTECTLIKSDTAHSEFPCTEVFVVGAVEDADYYVNRKPGVVNEKDVK